jgi:hypothetical protein
MASATQQSADLIASQMDCDVILYSGPINREAANRLETQLAARRRRKSVLVLVVSPGGDPDAAFRIGRALQAYYPNGISALIPGWCKSAGTLVTLAASTIYIGDLGELGPLDIQVAKQDEIGEAASGLLIETTLRTLETTSAKMFVNMTKTIRGETGVTTKLAAELSAKMVIGLMTPLYGQIEPLRVGENARAMNITMHYGRRLAIVSKCLLDGDSLDFLVRSYPDYGFVIDRKEAGLLFKNVEEPTPSMRELMSALGQRASYPPEGERTTVEYLSTEAKAVAADDRTLGEKQNVQHSTKTRGRGSSRGVRPASVAGAGVKGRPHRANGARPSSGPNGRTSN